MKKQKITYGISGMMEYQAVIKLGRNSMRVNFSDGSVSAMGINPAIFTTENFMVQHAIENSADFKRGLIKRINVIDLDEELSIERPASEAAEAVATPIEAAGEVKAEPVEDANDANDANVQVEFSCKDDAKDYLEQTFGLVRSKLRTRDDIVAAGKANGVDIYFV